MMRLSILTPCQDDRMLAVLEDERTFMHGRDTEWLIEDDGASVSELRRRLIARARGEAILWWDADDWISQPWIELAERVIESGAAWVYPPRVLRFDVHTLGRECVHLERPLMTGGMMRADLARSVPYPDPVTPGGDADSQWWELVRRATSGVAVETQPGAIDVVLTVHGRNLLQGPVHGTCSTLLPAAAVPHIRRVHRAVGDE